MSITGISEKQSADTREPDTGIFYYTGEWNRIYGADIQTLECDGGGGGKPKISGFRPPSLRTARRKPWKLYARMSTRGCGSISITLFLPEERLGDWPGITVTSSAPWNVEITAAGVHKGAMVKRAAKQFGLSADEVLVFGDGENDSFMFRTFPHSRAMENAAPCILRQAEKVIESNIADGVAQEIERVLPVTVHR